MMPKLSLRPKRNSRNGINFKKGLGETGKFRNHKQP